MKIYSEMTDDEVRAEYLAAIQGWEDAVNYDSYGGADLMRAANKRVDAAAAEMKKRGML